jgi:hypothetical protein
VRRNPLGGQRLGVSTGADETTRDDWRAAIAGAMSLNVGAVELCALGGSRLSDLVAYLASQPNVLDSFEYVSAHAPAKEAVGCWPEVVADLKRLPEKIETIVVHPDTVDEGAVSLLRPLTRRVCFENMDCSKLDGRFPAELAPVFDALPEAGFCLDVAHVVTNDPSVALAFELLDAFGERLRQLHVSGIEADGTHRELRTDDLERYAEVLDRCRGVPLILESQLASTLTRVW